MASLSAVYVSVCHTSVISNRHHAAQQKKQVQKHKPPSTQIYQKKSSSKLGLSTMRHSHSCRSFCKIRNFAPQKNSTANYMLKFAIIIVIAAGCISFSTSASRVFIWTSHHPSRIFAHICNAWRWPHEFSSVCLRALTKVKQGIDWLMINGKAGPSASFFKRMLHPFLKIFTMDPNHKSESYIWLLCSLTMAVRRWSRRRGRGHRVTFATFANCFKLAHITPERVWW